MTDEEKKAFETEAFLLQLVYQIRENDEVLIENEKPLLSLTEYLESLKQKNKDNVEVIQEIIKIASIGECDEITGSLICSSIQYLVDENERLQTQGDELETENRRLKTSIYMNNDHYLEVDKKNKLFQSKLAITEELCKKYECNPDACYMNKPDHNGEVYGCEGGSDKGCVSGFATELLQSIRDGE